MKKGHFSQKRGKKRTQHEIGEKEEPENARKKIEHKTTSQQPENAERKTNKNDNFGGSGADNVDIAMVQTEIMTQEQQEQKNTNLEEDPNIPNSKTKELQRRSRKKSTGKTPFHGQVPSNLEDSQRFIQLNKLIAEHEIKVHSKSKVPFVPDAVKHICSKLMEEMPKIVDKHYQPKVIHNPQNEMNRVQERTLMALLASMEKEEKEMEDVDLSSVDVNLPERLLSIDQFKSEENETSEDSRKEQIAKINEPLSKALVTQGVQADRVAICVKSLAQLNDTCKDFGQKVIKATRKKADKLAPQRAGEDPKKLLGSL